MVETNGSNDDIRGTEIEPEKVVQVIWTEDGRIAVQHSENVGFPDLVIAASIITRAANKMQDAHEAPVPTLPRPELVHATRLPS